MHARGRGRRLGFSAALATGLTLIGLSFSGMASLDDDLRAAAEQTPSVERVSIDLNECRRERRHAVSTRRT